MPVTINGTTGLVTSSISTPAGTAATPSVSDTAQDAGMFFPAANTVALSTSNAERVRIDSSGNVGVGTNSAGGYRVAIVGPAASSIPLYLTSDATNGYVYTPNSLYMGSTGAYQLALVTNNTERVRIDGTTGNVAVGTTETSSAKFQVFRGPGPQPLGEVYGSDGVQWWSLNSNAAAGGYSPLVSTNDHALIYSNGTKETGGFTLAQWSDSAKGLRIDSSGNVGIGTSSPSAQLDVYANVQPAIRVRNSTGITDLYALSTGDGFLTSQAAGKSLLFGTVGAEKMRITASGGVSFGASGAAYGSSGQVLVSNGDTAPTWGSAIVSGTAKAYNWNGSTTNNYIDFENIPSWVKRITVMFNGVSTSSTSPIQIQIGDSGGIENSGYSGTNHVLGTTNVAGAAMSSGFLLTVGTSYTSAAGAHSGLAILTNITGNQWVISGSIASPTTPYSFVFAGAKTLSDTLDRVRITTVAAGTNYFDAGSINILYE